jgi:hypothetical protein
LGVGFFDIAEERVSFWVGVVAGRDDLELAADFARGFTDFVDDFCADAFVTGFFATNLAVALLLLAAGFALAAGFLAADFFGAGLLALRDEEALEDFLLEEDGADFFVAIT